MPIRGGIIMSAVLSCGSRPIIMTGGGLLFILEPCPATEVKKVCFYS